MRYILLALLLITLPLMAEDAPPSLTFNTEAGQLDGFAGCYTQLYLSPKVLEGLRKELAFTPYAGVFEGIDNICSPTPLWCDNYYEPYLQNQNGSIGVGNLLRYGRSAGTLCDRFMHARAWSEYNSRRYSKAIRKAAKLKRKLRKLKRK